MIVNESIYNDFLSRLAEEPQIALDTEADSLHCYFEKLCLVQVGYKDEFHLIDPLVNLPLTRFFETLKGKQLLFHDADYDLRLLRRSGSFPDENIFDTMIAARLCGESQLGLAALVEKYFNVKLSKASRKANWALRPLSSQMIDYALNDVRYLSELAAIFEDRLYELKRLEWFYQSRDRMVRATCEVRVKEEDMLWRISGYLLLPPQSWAVLRAIWQWRDQESRKWDKPPFYILSNDAMLQIAERAPLGKKFQQPKLPQARIVDFQDILEKALALPEEEWPKPIVKIRLHSTKQELDRFQYLKDQRDRIAEEIGLDPSIIASKAALESEARSSSASLLLAWQKELLGIK